MGRRPDVLRVVRTATAPLGVAAIAEQLGVHPNTVRFHLDRLIANGQVEQAPSGRRRPGRPPLLYRAVRGMDPTGPRRYRLLAEILAGSLAGGPDPGARAVDAGRAWGRGIASPVGTDHATGPEASVERLVALLDALGFAPERRDADGRVRVGLRNCPFLELARASTQVVCPVHLGLMQGALDAWDAPVTADRLDAFIEPDLCLAHLVLRAPR